MIGITISKWGRVRIKFRHVNEFCGRGTECLAIDLSGEIVASSQMVVDKNDCKEYRRKATLKDLIAGLDREERTIVWATYFAKQELDRQRSGQTRLTVAEMLEEATVMSV